MNKIIYTLLFFAFALSVNGQQVAKSKNGSFLLKGATLHTVTNGNITGDILIKDGMIADIGPNVAAGDAEVIDASGKHIYPGFIDGGTRLGLAEVNSVSLTVDFSEIGDFIPQMKALTAVNPNSVSIPVTRTNGVTTVIAAPAGGLFPGTAALINLHGYTPEQMYAGFSGVVLNFPSSGRRGRWDRRSEEDIKKATDKALKKLNDIIDKARLYAKIDSAGKATGKNRNDYNPEMEAMLPVINGEQKLLVEVNDKASIQSALKWLKEEGFDAILTGVSEGHLIADEIAEAGFPVITGPVLRVPGRSSAAYDIAYRNPGILQQAGVKVAIRTQETENVRNLPFNAGFAATYGMGVEEALKAITIVPAEIMGLADKYGSLEKGKVANLFVATGDPFEMKTDITHLFINGWNIPIENRHTLLYNEFLHRAPGLKK